MAKKAKTEIEIQVAIGCIHYQGEEHAHGSLFICNADEAARLIELGVAVIPEEIEEIKTPAVPAVSPIINNGGIDPDAQLLAAIAAAQNLDELMALVPEDEPSAAIAEAFSLRHAELDQAE